MDFSSAQITLTAAGIQIDTGLTPQEFDRVENIFGFTFPPDLREFLSAGLPISEPWMNWRRPDHPLMRARLARPLEGIWFDIKNNAFWLEDWGPKPTDLNAAVEIARHAARQAPLLIPIYSNHYIPAAPREPGNPVFSVHQTDIICYGTDLMDYLQNEFSHYFGRNEFTLTGHPRTIPFWSTLAQ